MGDRDNNFGVLRLLFAGLVIVSHSPEMLDGDRSREILHSIFGTLTFGRLAVDAFFLISGYLIAKSFASSRTIGSYFLKRVLRIYPAFVVCSLLCLLVVAPLAGADLGAVGPVDWIKSAIRIVTLHAPEVEGALKGLPYPALNGAAWTIVYEFRCYIMAALFGMAGLYARRSVYLALTIAVLAANVLYEPYVAPHVRAVPGWFVFAIGDPIQNVRLVSAFMVGTCFWLYHDRIPYSARLATVSAALAAALLFSPLLAESGLVLFGGYALFWFAFKVDWKPLRTINAKDDISYGLYLYGWPIAALIIWYWRDVPVVALGALTYLGATLAGALSWFLVEKHMMRLRSLAWPFGTLRKGGAQPASSDGP